MTVDRRIDFYLEAEENGTLLRARTDKARDWTVDTFKMLADPNLSDEGLAFAVTMLRATGHRVEDKR